MCSQVTDRAQARGAHWFGIRNAESYKAIGLSEAVAMSLWLEKNININSLLYLFR